MNITKIVTSLPQILKRHKLIKILTIIFPDSYLQIIPFNKTAKIFADLRDAAPRQALITGFFEPEFFSIAKPFLANGGIFFDVGANWGFCSFGLIDSIKIKNLQCHLFEANSYITEVLFKTKKLYKDYEITVNNCCVTNKEGISYLTKVDYDWGRSYINEEDEGILVFNLILDQYIKDNQINKIDFMKLDIEGHEYFALDGLSNALKKETIDVIYFEVFSSHLQRKHLTVEDSFQLLRNYGYKLFFCKKKDYDLEIVPKRDWSECIINGYKINLAKLSHYPNEYSTDILAIHNSFIELHNLNI